MRLIFLEQDPRFVGGSERMSLALCRHARTRGHAAWLVHATPGEMVAAYASTGAQCRQLPVYPLAVRCPLAAARSLNALGGLVRRERIDAIFTSQVSYVSLLAALGLVQRVRSAVHLGLPYDFPSPLFRAGMRRISLGVAPSAHTAEAWRRRGWPARTLRMIPNGVDTAVFRPAGDREGARRRLHMGADARPLVAFVGRLVPEKGIFTLLRAWAAYRRAGGAGRLLLVGPVPGGVSAELARIAADERLAAPDWEVRAATPRPEDIYRAADLVVVPSEWDEPFGLVPLEALACGTLVVVSDRGVLPEFVAPLGRDAVFTAGQPAALAERLAHWLGARDRREAAAGRLADHVRTHFGFERCGDAYLATLQEVARR